MGDPGMRGVPQHLVTRVDEDPGVEGLGELGRNGDVVVVGVGADDPDDRTTGHGIDDRPGLVGSVDDEDLAVVTDHPDVVVDLPLATVEGEHPRGHDPVDPQPAHTITTERST